MPALSYAVEHGAEGAVLGWQRVASSSTYPVLSRGFNHFPVWSVRPRTLPLLPSAKTASRL